MSKLKDDLNKLFEEIRKAENECNFAQEFELTDVFLTKAGKLENWIYHKNKTGSNVDFNIASKILYLTEEVPYEGLSSDGLIAFTQIFFTGTKGRKSPKEALKLIQNWTLKEDPRVAVLLGNLWESGIAVGKVSLQKAAYQYYLASCEYHGEDGYNYARLLYDGRYNRDYREAFRVVSGAMQPLTVGCLNLLGRMFIEGKATCYNPKLAYRCFHLSATWMYNQDLVNYALLTFFGIGCKADKAKASKLLKIADFAGSDNALELLHKLKSGEIHTFTPELLEKIPSNFNKHLKSLTQRANTGDVKAMNQLGDIYFNPIVFSCMCRDKACFWFLQAAEAGSLYAAVTLKELLIHYVDNVCLSEEAHDCLIRGQFKAEAVIADKIMTTDLVDITIPEDLEDFDNELSRARFCPFEAMYWAIAIKDEPNEKFANDWRGWLEWQEKEGNSLRKAIHKLQPKYEDEFTGYDNI